MTRITASSRFAQLWAAFALLVPMAAGAQTLPTAAQVASGIGVGWNLGNTMEVPKSAGGPTGWGNPLPNQQLIDGVKAAGFNAVRLPCAWDGYADASHKIDPAWLAQVKSVVDMCVKDGLYVVLNIHWDGGWLENHPLAADQSAVLEKQKAYWTQIATHFRDYDEHLIFAGMNEVNVNWQAPTNENITAQQAYLQAFVDAVRATGGNNASRTLAIQTYSTNIGYGLDRLTLPKDSATGRLMVEIHFYDPYQYTGETTCKYWGSPYPAQSACSWAQESWVDDRFSKVKARWVDQGVPVIVGEYGSPKRSGQSADEVASRLYYLKYVNTVAARNGLKTFYWDTGVTTGNEVSSLFTRSTGAVFEKATIDAILQGAGVTPGPATNYALTVTKAGGGSGTVASSPSGVSCGTSCTASYAGGTSVTLTATPATGSSFAGWSGACTGTGACTVSMSKAQSVTATFSASSPSTYAVQVTKAGTGGGTVASTPAGVSCGATCTASFTGGTSVTLTATPDAGSTFVGWGGACNGTGTCTVSMTSAQSVTATFDRSSGSTYTLSVGSLGEGTGKASLSPSGQTCALGPTAAGCKVEFSAGTSVTVTATADRGSSFLGWSGACSGAGTCTVSMTEARTVTARLASGGSSSGSSSGASGSSSGSGSSGASGSSGGSGRPGSSGGASMGCASGGGAAAGLTLLAPGVVVFLLRRRRAA